MRCFVDSDWDRDGSEKKDQLSRHNRGGLQAVNHQPVVYIIHEWDCCNVAIPSVNIQQSAGRTDLLRHPLLRPLRLRTVRSAGLHPSADGHTSAPARTLLHLPDRCNRRLLRHAVCPPSRGWPRLGGGAASGGTVLVRSSRRRWSARRRSFSLRRRLHRKHSDVPPTTSGWRADPRREAGNGNGVGDRKKRLPHCMSGTQRWRRRK